MCFVAIRFHGLALICKDDLSYSSRFFVFSDRAAPQFKGGTGA
jgi:hypothetical protein